MNNIIKAYSELGTLWQVKEKIRLIHKISSSMFARISYDNLIARMRVSSYPSVRHWTKTLHRWYEGILQYFERHTTNGYTEGVNNKLKLIKRLSYGLETLTIILEKQCYHLLQLAYFYHHI